MPAVATTLPLIGGRYRLLRSLAVGGMGELFLAAAQDEEIEGLEQLVVIKRILPEYAADPNVVTMFLIEARIAARLDHPNIVRVYDMGRADGSIYFTMEYLHGTDLGELIDRARRTREGFPLGHALTIGLGLCGGLHFAHEMRRVDGRPMAIVHRDVSPSNVFITYHGEVKLVDFGIAKVVSSTQLTQDGMRKGKIAYMSPEQVRGESVDRRSDVFGIGILLYEMVTLSHLFDAAGEFEILEQIVSGEIPRPSSRRPGLAPELEAIILKALALSPYERYPTAQALAEDLERFARAQGLVTSHISLRNYVRRTLGDRPFPWYSDEQGPDEVEAVERWFRGAQPESVEGEVEDIDVSLDLEEVFAPEDEGVDDFDDEPTPIPVARPRPPSMPQRQAPPPSPLPGRIVVATAIGLAVTLALLIVRRCRRDEETPPAPPVQAPLAPPPLAPPPLRPPPPPPVVEEAPIIVPDAEPEPPAPKPAKKARPGGKKKKAAKK